VPRAEIEGDMGASHPGLQARLMSQALRKLSGAIKTSNTAIVFTNQLRHKIGVMFGSPETTSGGMALKFYSSVRLDIRRIQAIKAGGEVTGNRTRVRVKKNKVAPPFRECEFDIMYDEGISKEGDVLDLGVELDIIEKRGSFYSYNGERLAQGRENTKQVLRENPALCFEMENTIRRETGLPELELSPASDSSDALAPVEDETLKDHITDQAEIVGDEEVAAVIEA
jgi:recombination protein RecA